MKVSLACFAVVSFGCVVGLERGAAACLPPEPGLFKTVPAEGQKYPGNAALIFTGHQITLDKATVTVDGQPASLVDASDLFPYYGKVALIEPMPAPGQAVVVAGDFCADPVVCPPETLSFVAAAVDAEAPAAPEAIHFDVHDYPDFMSSPGDCQTDSDVAYWIEVEGTPAAEGEAPVLYTVEALADAASTDPLWTGLALITAGSTPFVRRAVLEELVGEQVPEAFCYRVRAMDTAGHAGAGEILTCKPCHYRADPPGTSVTAPEEPAWTEADIYPGGMCGQGTSSSTSTSASTGGAGGGTSTGGVGVGGASGVGGAGTTSGDPADSVTVGGCGCRAAGSPEKGRVGWLIAALGATLAAARRQWWSGSRSSRRAPR